MPLIQINVIITPMEIQISEIVNSFLEINTLCKENISIKFKFIIFFICLENVNILESLNPKNRCVKSYVI